MLSKKIPANFNPAHRKLIKEFAVGENPANTNIMIGPGASDYSGDGFYEFQFYDSNLGTTAVAVAAYVTNKQPDQMTQTFYLNANQQVLIISQSGASLPKASVKPETAAGYEMELIKITKIG